MLGMYVISGDRFFYKMLTASNTVFWHYLFTVIDISTHKQHTIFFDTGKYCDAFLINFFDVEYIDYVACCCPNSTYTFVWTFCGLSDIPEYLQGAAEPSTIDFHTEPIIKFQNYSSMDHELKLDDDADASMLGVNLFKVCVWCFKCPEC